MNELYNCDKCDFSSSMKDALSCHRTIVHDIKSSNHECDMCGKGFDSKAQFNLHVRVVHEGKKLKCPNCEAEFANFAGIRRHQREVHDKIMIQCKHCEFQCLKQGMLTRHIDKVHKAIYKCNYCNYESSYLNLKAHIKVSHEIRTKTCPHCDKTFKIHQLQSHIKKVHLKIRHKCDQCDSTYQSKTELREHKQFKHLGIRIACKLCNYETNFSYNLRHHFKMQHANKTQTSIQKYECNHCGNTFPGKMELELHKSSMHENNIYKCFQCPFESLTSAGVQIHHSEKHPTNFMCKKCNFADIKEEKVRNHFMTNH